MVAWFVPMLAKFGLDKGRKMLGKEGAPSPPRPKIYYLMWLARLLQFVLGIVVMALYTRDVDNARRQGKYADSKWVFALSTGSIAALAALILSLPKIKPWLFFPLDAIVWLLHLVVFGIFGSMYISEDPEGNSGIQRMKNAVWVVLTALILWTATAIAGGVAFWRVKKSRSQSVV